MKKLLQLTLLLAITSAEAQFWTQQASAFTTASRGINSISIADANNIWAKSYDGMPMGSMTVKEFTKSSDGGVTWVSGNINLGIGTTSLAISSITAVSGTTAWVSANPTGATLGGIWKTTNSGTTWTKQATALFNDGVNSFANYVYFQDANNGICQGDPQGGYFEIYTTVNGGTNWTRVPSANIAPPLAGEFGYTNSYAVVGTTMWFGTNFGRLYRSSDNGLTWTVAQTPITDFGGAAASGGYSFSDTLKGVIISNGGALYKTLDGGATWNIMSYNGTVFTGDIDYIPGTVKLVSSDVNQNSPGSSYSLDDGLNWVDIDAVQHTVTSFLNSTVGISGGFNQSATVGGVFRYTGTVLPTDTFSKTSFSVFPNPSSDVVTIQNSNQDFTSILITDSNGKSIKNLEFNSVSEKQFSVSELTTGIYFITVGSEKGNSVIKFMKN